jgi:hypothetical protein
MICAVICECEERHTMAAGVHVGIRNGRKGEREYD